MMFFRVRNSMNPVRYVLAAFMVFLLCGMAMAQQETGQISGTVKDPSGAVVPDVAVQVRSLATSAERTASTSGSGYYTVTNLQPGNYSVTVSKAGFSTAKMQVEVNVGGKSTADFTLAVGSSATTIEVVGGAIEQVNVESQTLVGRCKCQTGRDASHPYAQSV